MMRIPFSYKWRKRNPIKPVWFSVLLRKKSRVKGSWLSAQMFILQLCGTLFLLRCSWLILISLWYLLKTTMTNLSYVLRIFFRNFRKLVIPLCPIISISISDVIQRFFFKHVDYPKGWFVSFYYHCILEKDIRSWVCS